MRAMIVVNAEHIGGPCKVSIESEVEPNQAAFNVAVYDEMCDGLNALLTAMFDRRDAIRFDREQTALRARAPEEEPPAASPPAA